MDRIQRTPTVVDLFAGAGGFGLGFELAGFDVQLSLENDVWAADTLRFNHPDAHIIQGDIRDFWDRDSIRGVAPHSVDVVIGGPPCQGFSIAGPARKDPADPRNSLFVNFAQWVEVLQPKAFVMENVKGLLARRSADGEKVIEIIRQTLTDLGYLVEIWLLNAAEFGVPQLRERIFVVGHRTGRDVGPPPPTHRLAPGPSSPGQLAMFSDTGMAMAPSVWDAISDLPEVEAGEGKEEQPYLTGPETAFQVWARGASTCLYNHVAMQHSKRLVARFAQIRWGESSADVPAEHGAHRRSGNGQLSGKRYDQNNRRLYPYRASHTIAASFYANFVHPFQHRNLTAREGARIQSFPDHYRFLGKKTVVSHRLLHREKRFGEKHLCQYNQVGNAVPPLLARAVAMHLQGALDL